MKRAARLVSLLALSLGAPLAVGCGSSDDAPAAPSGADLEARLQSDTGVTWLVDRDDAGAPLILTALTPPPPVAAGVARDEAAIAFLQRYADLFGVGDLANELVLVEDREDRVATGVHHLRFAQRIP
ncbi:MAG TPA: hypothetical protein VLT33_39755, partial [Labilithrix sp.]|nr:hypothetical protein [Labilithrix sp.]